jgi:predicted ATPase
VFAFASFRLNPAERLLLEDGKPLRLGSRALEILITLVEHAGETVLKDQLIKRVWPDTVVDEGALRVHVAALRKALGDGRDGKRFIGNVPGRGYSFVAPVTREQVQEMVAPSSQPASVRNLPAQLTRVIGRGDVIATVSSRLSQHRLLTIIGPGGIGKTTVAVAAAEAMSVSCPDGVWFVGLSAIVDADLVPGAVGATLGVSADQIDSLTALTTWLRDKNLLIVLDCCEHVASAAAAIAEAVLRAAPGVCILATSREPLRAEDEWLLRLPVLETPSGLPALSATEALAFSAVELFNERATAAADGFTLSNDDVPDVLGICRRLDGMPLALELAAAQIEVFGVRGLAAALEDRLAVLTRGRRTALPRHQTLRAAIDWSYDLLLPGEQAILRRAAVFTGDFTMEMAGVVCAADGLMPADVVAAIANLAAKSLIATDISGETTHYRLFDSTRAYAFEKLAASGELDRVRRLHAEAIRDLLRQADAEIAAEAFYPNEWRTKYGPQIGNLRSALDWTLSLGGDPALGVALAAASTNFWIAKSLLDECCDWGVRALSVGGAEETREEMILQWGVGLALTYSRGMTSRAHDALTKALTLSEAFGDRTYQHRALYGLFLFAVRAVDIRASLELARKYEVVAKSAEDDAAVSMAEALLGIAQYCLGEHLAAADHFSRALVTPPSRAQRGVVRFGLDLRVCALCYQANNLWSLGFPEQAARAGGDATNEARALDHPVSLCFALAVCDSLLLVRIGQLDAAERAINELIEYAGMHSLTPYKAAGMCAKGTLLAAHDDAIGAEQLLRAGLEILKEVGFYLYYPLFLGRWAEALAACGRLDEARVAVDKAQCRTEKAELLWFMPEVLRIKGEISVRAGATASAVEELFLQSLDWARRQQALAWELRTATSLARFWRDHDRSVEAHKLLDGVYSRFTEGFDTADLKAAKVLLAELA